MVNWFKKKMVAIRSGKYDEYKELQSARDDVKILQQMWKLEEREYELGQQKLKTEKNIMSEIKAIWEESRILLKDIELAEKIQAQEKSLLVHGRRGTAALQKKLMFEEKDLVIRAQRIHNRLLALHKFLYKDLQEERLSEKGATKLMSLWSRLNDDINRIIRYAQHSAHYDHSMVGVVPGKGW